ncbi:MAG: SDR family NAD(P)-dependent oxidoreductase [Microcystis aeruginosa G13-12]|nr:SDR family NAD(P)-dependent oxidoreductase [Microcystis aeruginosa G13-12]NCT49879.1 SDR family NAD(P)-dependent oxidoreductase [Microcystis aeruginosa G13-03]
MDFQDKKNLSENEQSIQTRVFKALSEAKEKLKAFESQQSEPLAIVGLGCRFGHNIATPESFWSFLKAGKNNLREIPNERWNQQDFYDSDRNKVGKIYVSQGGFLDDVSQFDAHFFGIAPKEAVAMDPQQRLLLEVAYEALENAGMATTTARRGKTGVFIGITNNDYARILTSNEDYNAIGAYHISGNHTNAAAGRISYLLNLNGPSLAVDTACSSSLVAVHLACRSLRSQECRQALVGGVNLVLTPEVVIALCRNQMLAADGQCKTFDESADGFGIGEGCGVIVLKRLSDALQDGDHIWAVIRGTAVNNDGASGGFTVPNGPVQRELIREALADARLDAEAIDYVEAHGTGTSLGDPIEIKAIAEALCVNRRKSNPLLVGSLKTNLGHLAAAAGISGLIKTALSLHYREIPAHLNLKKPNPHINWDALPISIVTQNCPWNVNNGKLKAAGVSSFGASGTNAHVILSEPPQPQPQNPKISPILVTFSAKEPERLRLFTTQFVDYLEQKKALNVKDIALSLNTGRFPHKHRLALLVSNQENLRQGIQAFLKSDGDEKHFQNNSFDIIYGEAQSNPKIAFLCNDEQEISPEIPEIIETLLNNEPVFHDAFRQCDHLFKKYLEFSLQELLSSKKALEPQIPLSVQPLLFAYQYALCELWKSWGISPSAILGSGLGEYLAAEQAGVFSLEDTVKLVAKRAQISPQNPNSEDLLSLLKSTPEVDYNSPDITLIYQGEVVKKSLINSVNRGERIRQKSDEIAQGISTLHQMGYQIFLEMGISANLINIGRQKLGVNSILWLSSLGEDCHSDQHEQRVLGQLYVRGFNINWEAFHRSHLGQKISLPNSPFIRKRYWINSGNTSESSSYKNPNYYSGHPLLGDHFPSPLALLQYRGSISQHKPAFLGEHQVFDQAILPASALIEMALAAGENQKVILENVEFKKALILKDTEDTLQLIIEQKSFKIYHALEPNWEILVTGKIEELKSTNLTHCHLEEIAKNCSEEVDINSFYETYQKSGINYGSNFRLIHQLKRGENTAFAQIKLTDRLEREKYHFHPAMLDACFQGIAAILFKEESSVTYVPVRLEQLAFFHPPDEQVISAVRLKNSSPNPNIIIADIDIYSPQGQLLASLINLELKAVQSQEIIPQEIPPQIYLEEWMPCEELLGNGRDTLVAPQVIKNQIHPAQLEQQLGEKLAQYESLMEALEKLSVTYIWEALTKLNGQPKLGQTYSEAQIANQGQIVDFYRPLLSRCLSILAEEKIVNQTKDGWLFVKELEAPSSPSQIKILRQEFADYPAEISLMERCGSALAAVMSRQVEPLELLFPQGDLEAIAAIYSEAAGAKLMNQLVATTISRAIENLPPYYPLRILEIGGGTGAVTAGILPHLPTEHIEYVFTDISSSFLTRAKENFRDYPFIKYQTLDIEKNPFTQDFLPGSFDIIIAANVLHATANLQKTLENVRSLIAPKGRLILLESTGARRWVDLTFGLTEGWWLCSQDLRRNGYPLISTKDWQNLLIENQFEDINIIEPSQAKTRNLLKQSVIISRSSEQLPSLPAKSYYHQIIWADSQGIANGLIPLFQQRGISCSCVFSQDINPEMAEDYLSILRNSITSETRQILYFWGLEKIPGEIDQQVEIHCQRFLFFLQALLQQENPPALILVTQGAVPAKAIKTLTSPSQASLLGIAFSLVLEHPELNFKAIDLDPDEVNSADKLLQEIYSNPQENRVALRGEQRFYPRLVQRKLEDGNINFSPDGYYLITGGTGGLGLATTRWMIEKGARNLVLCSRRGAEGISPEILANLSSSGAEITIKKLDITDAEKLHTVLEECRSKYPVRGVFHIAGTLDDTTLLRLTPERFNYVLAPKVKGTWLLHQLTLNDPLEFFVCYTSAVSLIGSAGQANAAAANAFEDAFIYYRQAHHLPGTVINWGPWSEIGAAVDRNVLERLAAKGYAAMKPDLALNALEKILLNQIIRAGVIKIDWQQFPYIHQSFYKNFLPQGKPQAAPSSEFLKQWQNLTLKERPNWLTNHIIMRVSTVLGRSNDETFSPQQGFFDLGMDSLTSTELRNLLQTDFNCSLPSTITFRFPNVEALANYLQREVLDNCQPVFTPQIKAEISQKQPEKSQLDDDPIVIVGMACRFPGGAKNLQSFWELLEQGKDAITEIPQDRWDQETWYDPNPDVPGKIYAPYGAFLEQIEEFDGEFFGIIPRESVAMDPQQRLLLETTWQALESAGQNPQKLRNSQTGVFIGCMTQDYAQLSYSPQAINAYTGSGTSVSMAAGRLSYVLGLQGPSMTIDTACSSSLVAIHLAYNALLNGECDLALAGGVNIILTPIISLIESRAHMLAPDGHCKTFDESANGMVRGEGCGIVVLKRLSQAVKNGDQILAKIYGTAVNHDGPSSGLTVPNGQAQEKLLYQALKRANLKPEQIDYIEAHGTGTALGDPIELESMSAVFGQRSPNRPLIIGSVKTNLGHLEGAAGIAGLIKTVLALQHHKIPPHLHFKNPNHRFDWSSHIFEVPVQGKPWNISERPRIAGVSSFGFSGTNAHIIVGEIDADLPQPSENNFYLLPLSARSEKSLQELARNYQDILTESINLADVCFTASTGRGIFPQRICILADSITTAQRALIDYQDGENSDSLIRPILSETLPKIAFLFSGQGSQYSGMGETLYNREVVFKETLDICAQILEPLLEKSLLDLIFQEQNSELLEETQITQPVIFSLEYALAKLWQSWGIQPSALLGHSIGEYVAACWAGVFSLEDALKLVTQRGKLMGKLPHNGSMSAIYADYETVANALTSYENQVNIASANGSITVISGFKEIVEQLEKNFIDQGHKTKRLAVSHAFHSPLMQPILDDFSQVLKTISFHEPSLTIISNLTGKAVGSEITTPDYWVDHLRSTVQFSQGFQSLIDQGYRCFLEVGSKPVLLSMARLISANQDLLWLPSIVPGQDEQEQMYRSLATLFVNGYSVDWTTVFKQGKRIILPTYPFQRERYWLSNSEFSLGQIKTQLHPFIKDFKKLATGDMIFEGEVSYLNPSYLEEHQVFDNIVFPATGFIEAILAASQKIFNGHFVTLQNVSIHQGLLLSPTPLIVQIIFRPKKSSQLIYTFEIFSSDSAQEKWVLHVTGEVKPKDIQSLAASELTQTKLERENPKESISIREFYELYQQMGIRYGEQFQAIQELYSFKKGSQAKISINPSLADRRYHFHPVLLDACLQSIGAAFPEIHGQELHLPYGFSSLEIFLNPTSQVWTEVQVISDTNGEMRVNVNIYDEQGQLCARFTDLTARRINPAILQSLWQEKSNDCFYKVEWKKLPSMPTVAVNSQNSWLVLVRPETDLNSLINLYKRAGEKVITVKMGQNYQCNSQDSFVINPAQKSDFQRLYQEAYPSGEFPTGVVFSWESSEAEDVLDTVYQSSHAVLNLVQTLTNNWEKLPHLWLITRGANKIINDTALYPQQSHLWGLGAVINQEYPKMGCVCLDLPIHKEANEAELLFNELKCFPHEFRLALRQGNRYAARLVSASLPSSEKRHFINQSGVYLITGGGGKLGGLVAQWLSEMGASHLVLCSRHVKSSTELIAPLVEKGTKVTLIEADITSPTDMKNLFSRFGADLPVLRGIIHAAAVLEDGLISNQSWQKYQKVMSPKVAGTLLLDRYTRSLSLDFFVSFSSAAVILGSPGQSNYAAANAFMDALMQQRQSLGLPGISINWGAWETGNQIDQQRFANWGLQMMPSEQAFQYLNQVILDDINQGIVLDINWSIFNQTFNINQPFFSEVLTLKNQKQTSSAKLLERLKSVSIDERINALLEGLEKILREVTGLNGNKVIPQQTSFLDLGLNSLMVIEFKNRLETDLGCKLPSSIIFDYPNLLSLSTYLREQILANHLDFEIKINPIPDNHSPYDSLSEDELARLLNQKLTELDQYGG